MEHDETHVVDSSFDIRPMTDLTGAEILGVDLSRKLEPSEVADIRSALLRWKVIFFREQFIGRSKHLEFVKLFGEPTPAHPTLRPAIPAFPEIHVLDNGYDAARSTATDSDREKRRPNHWHTDVTFSLQPPMASILRGVVLPEEGGDTQWSNLAAAYAALPTEVRSEIDGLRAVHFDALPIDRGDSPRRIVRTWRSSRTGSIHPVVRVHPETGERSLFVNPKFTSHIVGLPRRRSRQLLEMLFEQIERQEFIVRFHWEPGSIAFWDNRATAHLAPSDVPAGKHRSMERITLAGDVPVNTFGVRSQPIERVDLRLLTSIAPRYVKALASR